MKKANHKRPLLFCNINSLTVCERSKTGSSIEVIFRLMLTKGLEA